MIESPSRSPWWHVVVALLTVSPGPATTGMAAVIVNWNSPTGSLAPGERTPGTQLTWLPDTPYYSAFGGPLTPPPLVFATTG